MPERFASDAYNPETTKLMGEAFEKAWADFQPRPKNESLARSLMATAIIEAVAAGVVGRDALTRAATVGLMSAIKADPDALNPDR
jgi:hypothetical protein